MRDYINRLSRGKSIFEIPKIKLSDTPITMNVIEGKKSYGSFSFGASYEIKGIVYSNEPRVKVTKNKFKGDDCSIEYEVDARDLKPNDVVEGIFTVVSSAGEKEIPFSFICVAGKVTSTLGDISNIDQFTKLALESVEEARTIYASKDFCQIILGKDPHLVNLYNSLFDEEHIKSSMEEFLVAAKKKSPIELNIAQDIKVIDASNGNDKGIIELDKTGWGYLEAGIFTDSDFITLSKENISSDDFTGDKFELEYIVDISKIHAGKNFAYITIETHKKLAKVLIQVNNVECSIDRESDSYKEKHARRQARVLLTKEYLNFRLKKTKKDRWINSSNSIIDKVKSAGVADPFFDLARAQLYLIEGKDEEGKAILESLKGDLLDKINNDVELYCYYLYVNTLLIKSEEYTVQVEKQVRKFFENGHDTYRILWILFYLTAETDSNKSIRLIRIKDAFNDGCVSPVMYLEAINIFNAQPVLLRVLNSFEMQVVNFGCKYEIITEKLADQIADVAGNEKNPSMELTRMLKALYEKYDNDEILTALVTNMIRNGVVGQDAFAIYEKAILRGLKITRLYEYYITSMKKDVSKQLPKMVLMYFAYDSTLNDNYKAFLYANIIVNKNAYKDIYDSFKKTIELFVYDQVKLGKINDYLVILYREILSKEYLNDDTKEFLMQLNLMYRLTCFDEGVKKVCVRHQEFTEPEVFELEEGKAFFPIYSPSCVVSFVCDDGIVRKGSVSYEVERLFEDKKNKEYPLIAEECFAQYGFFGMGNLMHKANAIHAKKTFDGNALEVFKTVKNFEEIGHEYKKQINTWMIDYYTEYYKLDDFWHEYPYIDTEFLSISEAGKLITILLDYGMYSQAYELIEKYNYDGLEPAKVLKLVDYFLTNVSSEQSSIIDELSRYVFVNNIYNENVILYMIRFFNSTNEEMYNLWKAAVNFNCEVDYLSERVLAQMLFTGVHSGRLTEVFTNYYLNSPDMLVVKAYLSYNAQLYVIRQKKANDIVFRAIYDCIKDNIGLPECCYVAWLKEISKNVAELSEDNEKRVNVEKCINTLCLDNKVYEFFKKFETVVKLPYICTGVTVMELIANPDCKVTITYTLNDGEEVTDVCKGNDWGIFTYRLNLFYSDVLKYHYTISGNKEERKTEEASFEYTEVSVESLGGRFDSINDCLASKELHDIVTLKKLMHSYVVEEYVSKQLFKPIR